MMTRKQKEDVKLPIPIYTYRGPKKALAKQRWWTPYQGISDFHFPEITLGVIKDAPRVVLADRERSGEDITEDSDQGMQWQERILEAQLNREQKLDSKQRLISARSGMDSIVCAADSGPKKGMGALLDSAAWKESRARMIDSHVFVVSEPVPRWFTDDEVRLLPEDHADWMKVQDLVCSQLTLAGVRYVMLPKDTSAPAARLQFVLDEWRTYSGI